MIVARAFPLLGVAACALSSPDVEYLRHVARVHEVCEPLFEAGCAGVASRGRALASSAPEDSEVRPSPATTDRRQASPSKP